MQLSQEDVRNIKGLEKSTKTLATFTRIYKWLLLPCIILGFALLPVDFTFVHGLILTMMVHLLSLEWVFQRKLSKIRTALQASCVMNGVAVMVLVLDQGMVISFLPVNIPIILLALWCIIGHLIFTQFNKYRGRLIYHSNKVGVGMLGQVIDDLTQQLIKLHNDKEMDVEEKEAKTKQLEDLKADYIQKRDHFKKTL